MGLILEERSNNLSKKRSVEMQLEEERWGNKRFINQQAIEKLVSALKTKYENLAHS
jgi:hypothetical protein